MIGFKTDSVLVLMLKLSRKADYGLISLKHMAMKNVSSARTREKSRTRMESRCLFSRKCFKHWQKTGFLFSRNMAPMAVTGFAASRRLITALEVIRSIDGPVFLTSCFTGAMAAAVLSDGATSAKPWQKVHEGIQNLLGGYDDS